MNDEAHCQNEKIRGWNEKPLPKIINTIEVCKNPDLQWNWKEVCLFTTDISYLLEHAPTNKIDWKSIYDNKNFKGKDVRYVDKNKFFESNASWYLMDCSIEFLRENKNKIRNWYHHSKYISITDIENNLDLRWDFYAMYSNPTLTIEFVERHRNENWCWKGLCDNKLITTEFIKRNDDNCGLMYFVVNNWDNQWVAEVMEWII